MVEGRGDLDCEWRGPGAAFDFSKPIVIFPQEPQGQPTVGNKLTDCLVGNLQSSDIPSFVILIVALKCFYKKANFFVNCVIIRSINVSLQGFFCHLETVIVLLWCVCKCIMSSERFMERTLTYPGVWVSESKFSGHTFELDEDL